MLATVIVDSYETRQCGEIASALDELVSPNDTWGWSSSGIYSFWNPRNQEVLYIGLAIDLPLRFRHHNGLIACPSKCCKWKQVQEYFTHFNRLGYSIIVQSSNSQGICANWLKKHSKKLDEFAEYFGYLDDDEAIAAANSDVGKSMRFMEAELLEFHRQKYGDFPKWNRIAGNVPAGIHFNTAAPLLLSSLTLSSASNDPFVSHRTLRELAGNEHHTCFEEFLHGERILMTAGFSSTAMERLFPDPLKYRERLADSKYRETSPKIEQLRGN